MISSLATLRSGWQCKHCHWQTVALYSDPCRSWQRMPASSGWWPSAGTAGTWHPAAQTASSGSGVCLPTVARRCFSTDVILRRRSCALRGVSPHACDAHCAAAERRPVELFGRLVSAVCIRNSRDVGYGLLPVGTCMGGSRTAESKLSIAFSALQRMLCRGHHPAHLARRSCRAAATARCSKMRLSGSTPATPRYAACQSPSNCFPRQRRVSGG